MTTGPDPLESGRADTASLPKKTIRAQTRIARAQAASGDHEAAVETALHILDREPAIDTAALIAMRQANLASPGLKPQNCEAVLSLAWRLLNDSDSSTRVARAAIGAIRVMEQNPVEALGQAISVRLSRKPDVFLDIEQHLLKEDRDAAIVAARMGHRQGGIPANDLALWRLAARTVLVRGDIGRNAALLHEARQMLPDDDNIGLRLKWLDDALQQDGSSLRTLAAADRNEAEPPPTMTELTARLIARRPPGDDHAGRNGAVILGGSLACGGAERIMANCYRELRERGDIEPLNLWLMNFGQGNGARDCRFYLPETGASPDEIVEVGSVRMQNVEPALRSAIGHYAMRGSALVEMLRERRPAILHCWLDQCCLLGAMAGILAGVPRIILHTHGMHPNQYTRPEKTEGWAEAYRAFLARPEIRFLNCSQTGLDDYLDWIDGGRMDRANVIHNGIDMAPFNALPDRASLAEAREAFGIPAGTLIIGTAFRFAEVKQPELWLETAALIHRRRPETHFILFGDGELHGSCRALADSLGFGDQVHMPGNVSDLPSRLPLFDLFLLSSASEGLPNVVIEAQAARVPVISFDIGGVREAVLPGKSAQLVEDHSAEALAEAALSWLGKRWRRKRAGRTGSQFVRKTFGLDRMVDQITAEFTG
jgi:glycosyltransferase involved in cell wall biosynthesis